MVTPGEQTMKIITATLVDATHLELSQPLPVPPGTALRIVIPDANENEEDALWQDAAKQHFLDAYSEEDALYDDL
jgi:hypothetical protein